MIPVLSIFIVILVIVVFILGYKLNHFQMENDDVIRKVKTELELLSFQKECLKQEYKGLEFDLELVTNKIEEKTHKLTEMTNEAASAYDKQKELAQTAFENYMSILNTQYSKKDEEYDELINNLQSSYENQQFKCLEELEAVKQDLEKIKATRNAAVEATVREQEIKQKLAFYCLPLSQANAADIQVLNSIKPRLANQRILSMLIWTTFFQKPMTTLCNNVLGTSVVTGIYKITNQKTNMCYIGQAVDMADRWKTHAKCGLGIDTPQNNKLYQAMLSDGIESFSWELLEACTKDLLNEKEKFYIDLYNSKNFGYNTTAGNK